MEAAIRDNPARYPGITPAQVKLAAAIIYAEGQTDETRSATHREHMARRLSNVSARQR